MRSSCTTTGEWPPLPASRESSQAASKSQSSQKINKLKKINVAVSCQKKVMVLMHSVNTCLWCAFIIWRDVILLLSSPRSFFSMCVLVTQSCPTLHNSTDCSPSGSSVHRIFQARMLEWVSIPFSRGSSQPRDRIQVSCIAGGFFTVWVTRVKNSEIFSNY